MGIVALIEWGWLCRSCSVVSAFLKPRMCPEVPPNSPHSSHTFPSQPQGPEAREPASGREEQHPYSRLRHGLPTGRGQSLGNQLRVSEPF